MATFNAEQIIGKTLIAKRTIGLKSLPSDASPVAVSVSPGQPLGTVVSYVNPSAGRTSLYWQISSNAGKNYWVKHETGAFDISDLKLQGAKTAEEILAEKKAAEEKENSPIVYYFKKMVVPVLITAAVIYVAVQLGKTLIIAKVK